MSALNAKDMATMESLIADDFVDNDAKPGMAPGRQGMIDMMGMFVGAFPDLNVVVDHWVAEGDLVAGVMTTKGTQTGEFMGMPASVKKILRKRDAYGPSSERENGGALGPSE